MTRLKRLDRMTRLMRALYGAWHGILSDTF